MPTHKPPEADLLHLNDDDELKQHASSKEYDELKHAIDYVTGQHKFASRLDKFNTATAAATCKNRSISNSPNVEPSVTPPSLPPTSAVVVKPEERQIWVGDAPPTQWTKFTKSPTSNVSSSGPKPVNFDMQRTARWKLKIIICYDNSSLDANEIVSTECEPPVPSSTTLTTLIRYGSCKNSSSRLIEK